MNKGSIPFLPLIQKIYLNLLLKMALCTKAECHFYLFFTTWQMPQPMLKWRPAHDPTPANLPLYHSLHILSIGILHKDSADQLPQFVQYFIKVMLDFCGWVWYYNYRDEIRQPQKRKSQVDYIRPNRQRHLYRKVCRFAVYKCEPAPLSWRNDGLCLLQSKIFKKKCWQIAQDML